MERTLEEIQQEIAQVRAALAALPDSAIRQGLDEDYMGQLDALIEEEAALRRAIDTK